MSGKRKPIYASSKTFQPSFSAMANRIPCKYLRTVVCWPIPVAFGLLWLDEPLSPTPLDIKASLGGLLSCVTLSEIVNIFFKDKNKFLRKRNNRAMTTATKKTSFLQKSSIFTVLQIFNSQLKYWKRVCWKKKINAVFQNVISIRKDNPNTIHLSVLTSWKFNHF